KVVSSSAYVSHLTFTNNIIAGTWTYPLNVPDNKAIWSQLDYNDIVPAGATMMIQLSGGTKTLSQLRTQGYMTHGTSADPLLTAPKTGAFPWHSASPAQNRAFNLGSPYTIGLPPASVWPSAVTTLDANLKTSGWDMGAFVVP